MRSCSLGTSTRPSKEKHHPAMVNAEPPLWEPPSATPIFRALHVALLHCGVPAVIPTAKTSLTGAASLSSLSLSHSGSSFASVPSVLSWRPSGSELPIRLGVVSNGSISSSLDVNAGDARPASCVLCFRVVLELAALLYCAGRSGQLPLS